MKFNNESRITQIALGATIAALYIVLFVLLMPISVGPIQFRLSEALTLLSALTPAAIPGLFIACVISNIIANMGWMDIVFGSLATLLAAVVTRSLAKKFSLDEMSKPRQSSAELLKNYKLYVLALPNIIFNALIVGSYLTFLIPSSGALFKVIILNIISVALSEAAVLYLVALPLYLVAYRIFSHQPR